MYSLEKNLLIARVYSTQTSSLSYILYSLDTFRIHIEDLL